MNTFTLHRLAILGMILALSVSHLRAQDTDPILGTWVLNVAKSSFNPGPAPKSETRTYVLEEQKTKMTARDVVEPRTYMTVRQETKATSTEVDSDGKATIRQWTMIHDGKDHPITGDPNVDTLSLKRIDTFIREFAMKKGGKVVLFGTQAVSRDGKVMTVTSSGTNAKGQITNDVAVFEKQ